MARSDPALLALRHAVENASAEPITDAGILSILRGEGGDPSHLRAVFGDASLSAILAAGASADIERGAILRAYAAARGAALAMNVELEQLLRDG